MLQKTNVVTVIGQNSNMAIELDLETINTVMEWFVQKAPEDLRTLSNVSRVIRFSDKLVELIAQEVGAANEYIEKRSIDRLSKASMVDESRPHLDDWERA
jgi:hypothetical protein